MSSSTEAPSGANSYDEFPYPSQPLPQCQPDRLAAYAALFGLEAPPADRCRVLELGCATGGNLIPLADRFPESQIVGVDYSLLQIEAGRRGVAELGLKNLELVHASIADLGDDLGTFDYITCHGVFSWVPVELQQQILKICRERLTPRGVAYISYNLNPGWHLRSVVRDVLTTHAPVNSGTAFERMASSRKVLEFLSASAPDSTPYGKLLKHEADIALRQNDSYVFHEYLETENHPYYFHEFVERASASGLQYLCDASVATMFASNFGPEVERRLMALGGDSVVVEQHLDLLRNRTFRQTLLCHPDVPLVRHILPERLEKLYLFGRLRPKNSTPDLKSTAVETFVGANGLSVSTPAPALKAALAHLSAIWPASISLPELVAVVACQISADGSPTLAARDRDALGHNLIQCLASGLIDVASQPDSFITTLSDAPRASSLARLQAVSGNSVTNRRHEPVQLDEAAQQVIRYLDGEHNHEAILQMLLKAVERGDLSILVGGMPGTRAETARPILEKLLSETLVKLTAEALIVA